MSGELISGSLAAGGGSGEARAGRASSESCLLLPLEMGQNISN